MKIQISLNVMHHPNKCESDIHKREKFKHDKVTFENHPLCLNDCNYHSGSNAPKGGIM